MEKENDLNKIEIPFLHKNLGFQKEGRTFIITLNVDQFNLKLLEPNEFKKYKNGKEYNYWGGTINQRTFNLTLPTSGFWILVVDVNNLKTSMNNIKHLLWLIK